MRSLLSYLPLESRNTSIKFQNPSCPWPVTQTSKASNSLNSTPGAMQPQPLSFTNMSWSLSISTPPSKNLLAGSNGNQDPQFLTIQSSKWCPDPSSTGLQRQSKKELSRILRTEAAIKAIEQKANSKKYNNLWPKAVLEALDDAIKENQWESALKVCGFFFCEVVFFLLFFSYFHVL